MPTRPITFISDYGVGDDFAGVCRAVIAKLAPGVQVIDVTHGIRRHDVRGGAAVLADLVPYSPPAVHLAIVDPGVGSERRPVAVSTGEDHLFVGPDNGLMQEAIELVGGAEEAVDLSASQFRLEPASATFHGRDVFAPIAARLAAGEPIERAGDPFDPSELVSHAVSEPRMEVNRAIAHVDRIDGFGNVALDLRQHRLAGHPLAGATRVSIGARGGRRTAIRGRTFEDVGEGAVLFYEDSSGRMAIAVNRGSAAEMLELRTGDEVELEPAP